MESAASVHLPLDPEPGAGPVRSEQETVISLRRSNKEAHLQVELWKERAEEAQKESIGLKSSVKMYQAELNASQKDLSRIRDEHERQAKLIKKLRVEIETKDNLLRNCRRALNQVTVAIEQNLEVTEPKDQLSREEADGLSMGKDLFPAEDGREGRNEGEGAYVPGGSMVGKGVEKTEDATQEARHEEPSESLKQSPVLGMDSNPDRENIRRQDQELRSTRNELAAVKQQLRDAVNLAESRGKELRKLSQLNKAKTSLSTAEVVQKVNALNVEIFQLAAFFGEVIIQEVTEPGTKRKSHRRSTMEDMFTRASFYLGNAFANMLAQRSSNQSNEKSNPLLVQITMQIALTAWCGAHCRRWTSYEKVDAPEGEVGSQPKEPGRQSILRQADHDRFISGLYDEIQDEDVACQWRSLARAHIPFSTRAWDKHLMVVIQSIMSIAGWATRSSEEMDKIEKRLSSIFKPTLELRKALGEDMSSLDLDICAEAPGRSFDASYMEDTYTDGRTSAKGTNNAPEKVVGTSGLGLQRNVVTKLKEGGLRRHGELLAMCKVVLESTVKEALAAPRPTRKSVRGSTTGPP